MKKNNNQTIKCDVLSCSFNDTKKHLCELDEIKVTCSCNHDNCSHKKETICDSFHEKETK